MTILLSVRRYLSVRTRVVCKTISTDYNAFVWDWKIYFSLVFNIRGGRPRVLVPSED